MKELIERIQFNLTSPLPGPDLQNHMAPNGRKEYTESVKKYTPAAVLCLIYPKNGESHMVFIQRTTHEKDKHSAQIAFPGGKVEPEDKSMIHAALREAEEEVGAIAEDITILGELTPLKIPVSGFEVFPILGYAKEELEFQRQITEVEMIIEVPIKTLTNPNNRQVKEIKLSNGFVLKDVPIFNFNDHVIWGATSMMLNEVIDILT